MGKGIDLKYTLIGLVIAAVIGWTISAFTTMPFWVAFAIVAVAMFINGLIADYEDNQPGGFNNPIQENDEKDVYLKT